jgi:hypothetical protein
MSLARRPCRTAWTRSAAACTRPCSAFREPSGQSLTEMKSLTSLPVFISETAPLSTSQGCNGGGYQTITGFMADLFSDGGDGILQFQDATTALTSAQWSELDAALVGAPHPDPSLASSPALPSTPALPEPTSPERLRTGPGNRISLASGQCGRERDQAAS